MTSSKPKGGSYAATQEPVTTKNAPTPPHRPPLRVPHKASDVLGVLVLWPGWYKGEALRGGTQHECRRNFEIDRDRRRGRQLAAQDNVVWNIPKEGYRVTSRGGIRSTPLSGIKGAKTCIRGSNSRSEALASNDQVYITGIIAVSLCMVAGSSSEYAREWGFINSPIHGPFCSRLVQATVWFARGVRKGTGRAGKAPGGFIEYQRSPQSGIRSRRCPR